MLKPRDSPKRAAPSGMCCSRKAQAKQSEPSVVDPHAQCDHKGDYPPGDKCDEDH
jgi:hypothetical protein